MPPTAACGRGREKALAQRSKQPERTRASAVLGTARGVAKQLRVPPSPPKRHRNSVKITADFHYTLLRSFSFYDTINTEQIEISRGVFLTFRNKNELARNIKIHNRLSLLSLLSTLAAMITFGFAVLFLVIGKMVFPAVVCFSGCCLCVVVLIAVSRYYKKETAQCPYEITLAHKFEYDEVKRILSQRAEPDRCRDFQNDSAFFCFLNRIFHNRFLVVNMPRFDKSDFDAKKKRINKAVNKDFEVTQWTTTDEARKEMRTNIIVTNEMNEPLYAFLSNNACTLLRRAEGIIHFAIAGDRLIIPPLFGEADMREVGRYKKSIKILTKLLNDF